MNPNHALKATAGVLLSPNPATVGPQRLGASLDASRMDVARNGVTFLATLLWVTGAMLIVLGIGMLAAGFGGWLALVAGACVLLTEWLRPSTLRERILEILARIGP